MLKFVISLCPPDPDLISACAIFVVWKKLNLISIKSAHRGQITGWGMCRGEPNRVLGLPVDQLEEGARFAGEMTWVAFGRLSMEAVIWLVGSTFLWYRCFIHSTGFCSPSFSLPPSHTAHDSVLWKGKREMGSFGSIPHGWSSQVLIPMLSYSPLEEITSQQTLSFTEVCQPGGRVMKVRSKYSFYYLQCVTSWIFILLLWYAGTSPLDS